MARKTKKEKLQASMRAQRAVNVSDSEATTTRSSRARRLEYTETDYDKKLRSYTKQDTMKTLLIIAALFVVQYVIAIKFS